MTLALKLQEFDTALTAKLLDPNLEIEHASVLLQLKAYIKTITSTTSSTSGGTGGGTTVDTTAVLNNILTAVQTNNTNNSADFDTIDLELTVIQNLLGDSVASTEGLATLLDSLLIASGEERVTTTKVNDSVQESIVILNNLLSSSNAVVTNTDSIANQTNLNLTLTAVSSTVVSTTVAQQILGSNTDRKYLLVQNTSNSNDMWLGFTSTTSSTTNSIWLPRGAVWELPPGPSYTGPIFIFQSSGNGRVSTIQGVRS